MWFAEEANLFCWASVVIGRGPSWSDLVPSNIVLPIKEIPHIYTVREHHCYSNLPTNNSYQVASFTQDLNFSVLFICRGQVCCWQWCSSDFCLLL